VHSALMTTNCICIDCDYQCVYRVAQNKMSYWTKCNFPTTDKNYSTKISGFTEERLFAPVAYAAPAQNAVGVGESIPVPTWTHLQVGSPFLCKNGIVLRASESTVQMLLLGHKITMGGLQLSSSYVHLSHLITIYCYSYS